MAAKTLRESLLKAEIKSEIQKALCVGPLHELVERIDKVEMTIIKNIEKQLRDYFSHQTMYTVSSAALFERAFGNISADNGDDDVN